MPSLFADKSYYTDKNFLACAVFILFAVAFISYEKYLERFDFIIYDKLISFQHPSYDSRIAIITIDDNSLKALGQWPWSRALHARLIDRLRTIDNKAVVFDLLFTEQQGSNAAAAADRLFAEAIARHGRVVLPVAPISESSPYAIDFAQPLPMFAEHAKLGHADVELDKDGVVRRVFFVCGHRFPGLADFIVSIVE